MKTYLFDFDGTLVDSMPVYAGIMKRILDENQIAYGSDLLKRITPLGYVGTADYYVEKMGVDCSREELIATMHRYAADAYTNDVSAKIGVVETLRVMRSRGDCLNILTASPHAALDPCLKRLGIYDWFTNVWSCEDFGTTKSDPEIYRMAAERLGMMPGNVIFVDDNCNANRTAKTAGMHVYGIYDESSAEYTEEMKQITDGYADTFADLLTLT